MVKITPSAVTRLMALLAEHPEEAIVRLAVKDLDDQRLSFQITLEAAPDPDDEIQTVSGLTVAIAAASAPRMDGVTLDYREPDGFLFVHPSQGDQGPDGFQFTPSILR
jgi:Fe-S cluster assembly iron-binding protein IscA